MNKQWKIEELKLLQKLGAMFKGRNWKSVAEQLKKQGFSRTEIQCRYKWVNYIAPGINHSPWSYQQLKLLFQQYDIHKSQWALIQRSMSDRTQIKIRNQFYGTIRNLLRYTIKYFKAGNGRWSLISNQIKPQTLRNLYQGIQQFQFVGSLMRDTIVKLEFKFNRIMLDCIVQENSECFRKIVQMISSDKSFLIKQKKMKQSQRNEASDRQELPNYHINQAHLQQIIEDDEQERPSQLQQQQRVNNIPNGEFNSGPSAVVITQNRSFNNQNNNYNIAPMPGIFRPENPYSYSHHPYQFPTSYNYRYMQQFPPQYNYSMYSYPYRYSY